MTETSVATNVHQALDFIVVSRRKSVDSEQRDLITDFLQIAIGQML
jgi:hypothetical protein